MLASHVTGGYWLQARGGAHALRLPRRPRSVPRPLKPGRRTQLPKSTCGVSATPASTWIVSSLRQRRPPRASPTSSQSYPRRTSLWSLWSAGARSGSACSSPAPAATTPASAAAGAGSPSTSGSAAATPSSSRRRGPAAHPPLGSPPLRPRGRRPPPLRPRPRVWAMPEVPLPPLSALKLSPWRPLHARPPAARRRPPAARDGVPRARPRQEHLRGRL